MLKSSAPNDLDFFEIRNFEDGPCYYADTDDYEWAGNLIKLSKIVVQVPVLKYASG